MQTEESNTTIHDPKSNLFAESSMCPKQNEADATSQNARMGDESRPDPLAQGGSVSNPAGLWIKKEYIDEQTEIMRPNGG